jgi:hypothetical protein
MRWNPIGRQSKRQRKLLKKQLASTPKRSPRRSSHDHQSKLLRP